MVKSEKAGAAGANSTGSKKAGAGSASVAAPNKATTKSGKEKVHSKTGAGDTPPAAEKTKEVVTKSIVAKIRAAATRQQIAKAKKRSRGDPPDSCGKAGDPHKEDGALVNRSEHISTKARRALDCRYVGAGGQTRRELGDAP